MYWDGTPLGRLELEQLGALTGARGLCGPTPLTAPARHRVGAPLALAHQASAMRRTKP